MLVTPMFLTKAIIMQILEICSICRLLFSCISAEAVQGRGDQPGNSGQLDRGVGRGRRLAHLFGKDGMGKGYN